MVPIRTRQKLTKISWWKYFGAKFSIRVRQGAQITMCVPRTGLSMSQYHQSTALAPPPNLPPVVAPASTESVPAAGLSLAVPAVVRPQPHTAHMVLFAQAMCKPAQVVQMWVVIILRNARIYMRPELKSRSGPLPRRSATWIVLIRDDVKLAQLVRARDCQSRGRRFVSGKNSKNRELKSTWI